jgi:hypothetical protein
MAIGSIATGFTLARHLSGIVGVLIHMHTTVTYGNVVRNCLGVALDATEIIPDQRCIVYVQSMLT